MTTNHLKRMSVLSLLYVASLMLLACGPVEGPASSGMKVRVINHYAESLFSVGYSYTDAAGKPQKGIFFSNERVQSGRSSTSTEVSIPASTDTVALEFVAVSLGEAHTFNPISVDMAGHFAGTYVIGYDYDLATASFRIRHDWDCFSCLMTAEARQ